jgi:hypothetical protein
MKDEKPFGVGGLWENWKDPARRSRPRGECSAADDRRHDETSAAYAPSRIWMTIVPDLRVLFMGEAVYIPPS